jgi:hypothetical protein
MTTFTFLSSITAMIISREEAGGMKSFDWTIGPMEAALGPRQNPTDGGNSSAPF